MGMKEILRAPEGNNARFQILQQLGSGKTGVCAAFDRETSAVVAVKTLAAANADARARFEREWRALAALQHPNLVRLGELHHDEGQWFVTMEFVRGKHFLEYVRRAEGNEGADVRAYDEARLRAAALQVASAISALHSSGHVHRDIKPDNVIVQDDGRAVVLDFGLLEGVNAGSSDDRSVVNLAFVAPEQADGIATAASDWYSFGVLLFVGITGTLPFSGAPQDMIREKRSGMAPRPSDVSRDVPEDLDKLCPALLAPAPENRPGDQEVLAVLGASSPPERAPSRSGAQPPLLPGFDVLKQAFEDERLSAKKLAMVLDWRVEDMATYLGKDKSTLSRNPTSTMYQDALSRLARVVGHAYELMNADLGLVRTWLRAPVPVLGRVSPKELILSGHIGRIEELLDGVESGFAA